MEQFKMPCERKEKITLDDMDAQTAFISYYESKQKVKFGGELSEVDMAIEEWINGHQEEVEQYLNYLDSIM